MLWYWKAYCFYLTAIDSILFRAGKCVCNGPQPKCQGLDKWFPCANDANCGENGVCNPRGICRCSPTTPTPPMQCQWYISCSANEDCGDGICDPR